MIHVVVKHTCIILYVYMYGYSDVLTVNFLRPQASIEQEMTACLVDAFDVSEVALCRVDGTLRARRDQTHPSLSWSTLSGRVWE